MRVSKTALSAPQIQAENRDYVAPTGGLGILLTRKLVDSVSYCRKHGNNVLSLTKILILSNDGLLFY